MIENYVLYLEFLNEKLEKFFNSQSPYIFCKKGCAKCCKNAQFPISAVELKYLLSGVVELDDEKQIQIEKNLKAVTERKAKFKGKKFLYDCPFLIDDACSVYEHRGVVCRAFGLMTNTEDNKVCAPFCCHNGLNYSNVLNLRAKTISLRKFKKLNTKLEPLGFNVRYSYLSDVDFENSFHFKFGEKKALIDWFIN